MSISLDSSKTVTGTTGVLPFDGPTPVGTITGVLVFVVTSGSTSSDIYTMEYGGRNMTLYGASGVSLGDEDGHTHVFWLGDDIPAGLQVISGSDTETNPKHIYTLLLSSTGSVLDVNAFNSLISASLDDPSISIATTETTFLAGATFSGLDSGADISAGTGMTGLAETDFGSQMSHVQYRTGLASGANSCPWTTTSAQEVAAVAIAIQEGLNVTTGLQASINVRLDMELTAQAWTDVTEDVLIDPGMAWTRGINGTSFQDLVADPGTLTFSLRNDSGNSGGLEGYYSPGHANVRSGFELGMGLRVRIPRPGGIQAASRTYKYYLQSIKPHTGNLGSKRVDCVATDLVDKLSRSRIEGLGVQVNVTDRALFDAIIDAASPNVSQNFPQVIDTFAYANDTVDDAAQTPMDAFAKLCESSFAHIVLSGFSSANDDVFPASAGERWTMVTRHYLESFVPSSTPLFDNSQTELALTYGTGDMVNIVDCESPNRRVDVDNETVLWSLEDDRPVVPAGETNELWYEYRDPDNEAETVSGISMQAPVANTDYTMNSTADGSGTDLTSDLTVTATFFASSVKVELQNTGSSNGIVTKLQGRGQGLYSFGRKHIRATDSASVTKHGERQRSLSLHWQQDPNVCQSAADWILSKMQDEDQASLTGARLTYWANSSEQKANSAWLYGPLSIITLKEDVSALDATGTDYWLIMKASFRMVAGFGLQVIYLLKRISPTPGLWQLGASAGDQLGTDTKLGAF